MGNLPKRPESDIYHSCSSPAEVLVTHDGDRLCERCYTDSLSDAWRHIERHKRSLVASLYGQQGPFWEAVSEARRRLGVTPKRDVPPPEYRAEPIKHNKEATRLYNEQVPEKYRRHFAVDWLGFLDACLEFDSPREELEKFAAFGGKGEPHVSRLIPSGRKLGPVKDDLPGMVAPPVKKTRAADGTARFEMEWEDVPTEDDARRAAERS